MNFKVDLTIASENKINDIGIKRTVSKQKYQKW